MGDFAVPGDPNWPTCASAVYYGKGARHEGGQPCRHGYVRDEAGKKTGQVSFPDAVMFDRRLDSGIRLVDLVMGVFVAGGAQGTKDQLKIYGIGKAGRAKYADEVVPTRDVHGRDYLVS